MGKYFIYGIGFFVATLFIQWVAHTLSKRPDKKTTIYTGITVIIGLCVIGIIQHEMGFLAGIIGFVIADVIGSTMGWH